MSSRLIGPAGPFRPAAVYGAKALVLGSHHESFGVVAVEAMACGLRDLMALTGDERAAMGRRGAALFRAEYDIADVSARLVGILERARAGVDIPRTRSAWNPA